MVAGSIPSDLHFFLFFSFTFITLIDSNVFNPGLYFQCLVFEESMLKIVFLSFLGLSTNKKSIHPRERLLIFLFHVGHNPTYEVSGYSHDISYGVIQESIMVVSDVLYKYLVPNYIKTPTPQEAEASANKFKEEGFPAKAIWACLDGTHILVCPPKDSKDTYFNRHRTQSLNVLLLVDAYGIFRHCNASAPGSVHDSAIFMNSRLYRKLEDWSQRNLPFKFAVIAGDSAFRRKLKCMCVPFPLAEADQDEMKKLFNLWFCKVRATIERYIGILKVLDLA